jgi:signal transduction histidine kinase
MTANQVLTSDAAMEQVRRVALRHNLIHNGLRFGVIIKTTDGEFQHLGGPENKVFVHLAEKAAVDAAGRDGFIEVPLPASGDDRPHSLYVYELDIPLAIDDAPNCFVWAVAESRGRLQDLVPLVFREFTSTCKAHLLAAYSRVDPLFIISKAFEAATVKLALRALIVMANAKAAILWMYHAEAQYYETDTVEGAAPGRYVIGMGKGVLGRVDPMKAAICYPSPETIDLLPYHPDLFNDEGWSRMQALPILWAGALVGAISIYWTDENDAPFLSDLDALRVGALASGFIATQQAEAALDSDFENVEKHLVRLAPAEALLSFIHDVNKSLQDVTRTMSAASVQLGQSHIEVNRELGSKLSSSARFVDGCLNRMGRLALLHEKVPTLARTDLHRLLDGISQLLQEHRTVKVELRFGRGPLWVHANRLSLERAVLNVVANAIYWTEAKPMGERKVTVSLLAVDNVATIEIADTGIGVGPEVRDTIFERFVTGRPDSGSGMGLYIVKEIMRAHRGEVTFESKPGIGATFRLTLPIVKGPS